MPTNCRNCGAPLDDSTPGNLVRCPFCGKVTREQPAPVVARAPQGPFPPAQGPYVPGTRSRASGALVAVLAASGMGLLIAIGAAVNSSQPTNVSHPTSDGVSNPTGGGDCPSRFGKSAEVDCTCGSGQLPAAVWGTDIYTTDSSFCAAAVHAGATSPSGGRVTARSAQGCASYVGTARNGVTTLDWGRYGSSFYFVGHGTGTCATTPMPSEASGAVPAQDRCPSNYPVGTAQIDCTCAPDQLGGTVWGTDLYTTDSAFCQAALHAGVVSAQGGRVSARQAPGVKSYRGTERNGVTTSAWGGYPHSFQFIGVSSSAAGPKREQGASASDPRSNFAF
jgi:hypothetical protein